MLRITVNGSEEKLNIGCRTFIALDELLGLLAAKESTVTLNGDNIGRNNLTSTKVNGGDSLILPGLVR